MSSNSVSAGENLVAGTAGDEAMPSDQKKGGRQKGATIMRSHTELERYQKACAEAAQEYNNAHQNISKGSRVERGALNQIIEDVKEKYNLEHVDIAKETIRTRAPSMLE